MLKSCLAEFGKPSSSMAYRSGAHIRSMTLKYSRSRIIHVCKCILSSDTADDVAAYCILYNTPALSTRVVLDVNFTCLLTSFQVLIPEQHQQDTRTWKYACTPMHCAQPPKMALLRSTRLACSPPCRRAVQLSLVQRSADSLAFCSCHECLPYQVCS